MCANASFSLTEIQFLRHEDVECDACKRDFSCAIELEIEDGLELEVIRLPEACPLCGEDPARDSVGMRCAEATPEMINALTAQVREECAERESARRLGMYNG